MLQLVKIAVGPHFIEEATQLLSSDLRFKLAQLNNSMLFYTPWLLSKTGEGQILQTLKRVNTS